MIGNVRLDDRERSTQTVGLVEKGFLNIKPGQFPGCGPLDIAVMLDFVSRQMGLSGKEKARVEMVCYDYLRFYHDHLFLEPTGRKSMTTPLSLSMLACAMAIGNELLPQWFVDSLRWWFNWADRGLNCIPPAY